MNPAPLTAPQLRNRLGAGTSPKDPKSNPVPASACTALAAGGHGPQHGGPAAPVTACTSALEDTDQCGRGKPHPLEPPRSPRRAQVPPGAGPAWLGHLDTSAQPNFFTFSQERRDCDTHTRSTELLSLLGSGADMGQRAARSRSPGRGKRHPQHGTGRARRGLQSSKHGQPRAGPCSTPGPAAQHRLLPRQQLPATAPHR